MGKTVSRQTKNLTFANNVWHYDLVPKKEEGDAKRRKRA